jgi:hypothetical protein
MIYSTTGLGLLHTLYLGHRGHHTEYSHLCHVSEARWGFLPPLDRQVICSGWHRVSTTPTKPQATVAELDETALQTLLLVNHLHATHVCLNV